MGRLTDIPGEEQARIDRELDAFFAFTEDVFADPSILDQVPDGADIQAVRIREREPGQQYDIETPNTVAVVTAPCRARQKPTRKRPALPSPLASRGAARTAKGRISHRGRSAPPPLPNNSHKRTRTG